jgi:hypothetical protein
MTTPFTGSEASFVYYTGRLELDALLIGTKWGGPAGTGAHVTYSFPEPPATPALWSTASEDEGGGYGPDGGPGEPWSNEFAALSPAQRAGAEAALQAWAAVADITFTRVDETPDEVGDIRIGSFRILGAGARVRRPRSCCFQNSVAQQLEPGAATHGPLDCLQAADLPLDRPRAPRQ